VLVQQERRLLETVVLPPPSTDSDTALDVDVEEEAPDSLLRAVAAAPQVEVERSRLAAGTVIDSTYRIVRVLGAGAMGVVYEAEDLMLDRRVAVKLHDLGTSEQHSSRMWREAKAMARLSHPNVVTVYEVGWHQGSIFIAMELVEGRNARVWRKAKPRTWREIVEVYVQAATGLHAAHRLDIVHRDFKPDNVLVGDDPQGGHAIGRVRVADFGLARSAGTEAPSTAVGTILTSSAPSLDSNLTRTGALLGTPAYMAPEQFEGRAADPRADQFAFCVALYEALYGVRPFSGTRIAELLDAIERGAIAIPRAPTEVPKRFHDLLRRGMAARPSQRWPDMETLARALADDPERRRRRAIVFGLGALSVAVMAWSAGRGSVGEAPCADGAEALVGTWDRSRRAEVEAAFDRTFVPFAPAATLEAGDAFDAWALAWTTERTDACTATRVRGEQSEARLDARMDCLDRQAVEVAALVDVLASADATVVAGVARMVDRLPDPAGCSDPELWLGVQPVPPDRRDRHDALFAALAGAAASEAAGHTEEARARLDELVPQVDALDHAALSARAHLQRGQVLVDLGRKDEAVADLALANEQALLSGEPRLLSRTMLELGRAVGRTSAGTDEALRWLGAARAEAARVQAQASLQGELDTARAEILLFGDRFEDTLAWTHEALARTDETARARVRLWTIRATALERLHRFEEALAVHTEAVALAERMRGAEHPAVAAALGNLAYTLEALERGDEAVATLRRALAIREAVFGAEAPAVGETHRQLGDALDRLGSPLEARAEYERAVAIHHAAGDGSGEALARANLAGVLAELGETEAAVDSITKARPLAERSFGPKSVRMGELLLNTASYLWEAGRVDEALESGERALAILEAELGPEAYQVGVASLSLGRILADDGRAEEGLHFVDKAARIIGASMPETSSAHGQVHMARADLLGSLSRWPEALAARRESVAAIEATTGGDAHPLLFAALMFHGRDLALHGDRSEARTVLERALAMTEAVTVAPDRVALTQLMLAQALEGDPEAHARVRTLATAALATFRELHDPRAAEAQAVVDRG
jgi:tetratricopeptide (TPR) repeat protein/tRNA A-37 threonylcarbamoyl transferase component Bud32